MFLDIKYPNIIYPSTITLKGIKRISDKDFRTIVF